MVEIGCRTFSVKRPYRRIGLYLQPGDTVDLPPDVAGWIERDSVGTLEIGGAIPTSDAAAETRVVQEPPEDRMVREAEMRAPEEVTRAPEEVNPIPHEVLYGATKSGKKRSPGYP